MKTTDIFKVTSVTDNVMTCTNINIDISKFKKIEEIKHKIYKKSNMLLLVDDNNNKSCVSITSDNNKLLNNNILIINSIINNISLHYFPFIDEYDDIIQRNTIIYDNIQIITEKSLKSNEFTTFIRLNNNNLQTILKLIK